MENKELLYPKLRERLEGAKRALMASEASETNKKQLSGFLVKLEADGTSKAQMVSYLDRLTPVAELLGDIEFKEATKRDMEKVFAAYRTYGPTCKEHNRQYSESSLLKAKQCIKCFYRWLFDLTSQDPAPVAVRWLPCRKVKNTLRSEDMWTEKDMEKVMEVARTLRDKCLLSVLFETGLRPGEIRGLRMRDVKANGDMIRLYVRGKTEKKMGERMVPVLRSYKMLTMWVSQHPGSSDPNAWLWTFGKDPINESTFRFMVRELAKKAGINKPVNPYILRHSALTRIYKSMPGTIASKLAGHAPGSKESDTYCHLADEDFDNSVREMNGVARKDKKETVNCMECGHALGVGDKLCSMCGRAKDQESAFLRIGDVEEALSVKRAMEAIRDKYPELGTLMDAIMKKEVG